MGRGIAKRDCFYEIDNEQIDSLDVLAYQAISLDKWNLQFDGNPDGALIIPSPNASKPVIPGHLDTTKNENQFGVHPRHVILGLVPTQQTSSGLTCLSDRPTKRLKLIVPQLSQWLGLIEYDLVQGDEIELGINALRVNHTYDGSAGKVYVILKTVSQRSV